MTTNHLLAAFGKGLQKAGHRVRLCSHVNFRQFVTENGLDFYPLKGIFYNPWVSIKLIIF